MVWASIWMDDAGDSLRPGYAQPSANPRSGLLYTWRRHLLEGSLGVTREPTAQFARVEVMAMPTDPAIPPAVQSAAPSAPMHHPDGMIEIALPGGVSVRVDAQVDSGALRRVLAALTRR
jgi:transposase